MSEVYFIVEGEIAGKGRPRVTTRGGFTRAYTPKRTVDCENRIRAAYLFEYPAGMKWEGKEPLEIVANVYMEIPKSIPKKTREQMILGYIRPTKKPDADNLLKTICDSLNGLCFQDDSQIVDAKIRKWYATEPKAEITIREIEKEK